jgi:hypothetical protein
MTARLRVVQEMQRGDVLNESEDESGYENCGFVFHVLVIACFLGYLFWIASCYLHSHDEWETFVDLDTLLYIIATVSCLFLSILFLYSGLNALSAPTIESIDGLQDDTTPVRRSFEQIQE